MITIKRVNLELEETIKAFLERKRKHNENLDADLLFEELMEKALEIKIGEGIELEDDYYNLLQKFMLMKPKLKLESIRAIEESFNRNIASSIMGGRVLPKYWVQDIVSGAAELLAGRLNRGDLNILNICSGTGRLLDSLLFEFPAAKFNSWEYKQRNVDIQRKLFSLFDVDLNAEQCDPLALAKKEQGFDLVLVQPALGEYKDTEVKGEDFPFMEAAALKNISYRGAVLLKSLELADEGGLVFAVVPDSLLYNMGSQSLREEVLRRAHPLAIISFENEVFLNTRTSGSVMLMQKKHKEDRETPPALMIKADKDAEPAEIGKLIRDPSPSCSSEKFYTSLVKQRELQSESLLPIEYIVRHQYRDEESRTLKELVEINPPTRRIDKEELKGERKVVYPTSTDNEGRIVSPRIVNVEEEGLPRNIRLVADRDDVLLQILKPEKNPPILVKEDRLLVSDVFAVLTPKIDPHYLIWALNEKGVRLQLEVYAGENNVKRISIKKLMQVRIPWLSEEERLEKSELVRKRLQKRSPQAEETNVKNTLDEIVNKIAGEHGMNIASRYEEKPLRELATLNSGLNLSLYKGGLEKMKLIRAGNLSVDGIRGELDEVSIKEGKSKPLEDGDIIFRYKGDIGPASVVRGDLNQTTYDSSLVRIRVNRELMRPEFLAMYLNSGVSKELLAKDAVEKSIKYVRLSDLKKLPVKLPPLPDQDKFLKRFKIAKKGQEL